MWRRGPRRPWYSSKRTRRVPDHACPSPGAGDGDLSAGGSGGLTLAAAEIT